MSAYSQILAHFAHQGLNEHTEITRHEIGQSLDSITRSNTSQPRFDPEVAEEIWNETVDTLQGEQVRLSHIINTIIKAQITLRQRADALQGTRPHTQSS